MPKVCLYGGKRRRSDGTADNIKDDKDDVSSSSDLTKDEPSSDLDILHRKRKCEPRDSADPPCRESSSCAAGDRNGLASGHVTQDVTNSSTLQKRLALFSSSSAFDIFSRFPGMHFPNATSGGVGAGGSAFMAQPFSLFNSYPPLHTYVSNSDLHMPISSVSISPGPQNVAMVPLLPWQGLSPEQLPALTRCASDVSALISPLSKLDLSISFNEYFENMKISLEKGRSAKPSPTLSESDEKDGSDTKKHVENDTNEKDDDMVMPLNYVKGEYDASNGVTSQRTGPWQGKRLCFYSGSETDTEDDGNREGQSPTSPANVQKAQLSPSIEMPIVTSALPVSSLASSSASSSYIRRLSDPLPPGLPPTQHPYPDTPSYPHPASQFFSMDKLMPPAAHFALAPVPGVQISSPAGLPAAHPAHGHPLLSGHLAGGVGVAGSPGVGYLHPTLMQLGSLGAARRPPCDKPPAVKKYKCDVCDKAFSRSNTLVTHKRIHTGDKPFKCERCGRAFRQPGNLTRHMLTHTTHKPYVCQHCGKAFNRASNLNTHIRTHTNARSLPCVVCGKAFNQKVDLRMHMYSHGGWFYLI
ncbi:hypothetical protein BaRGS_00005887 [Batillaria attramentaria]|uniref:C2H2-type domain-containing protein n=1 Tax=Batillaria attramentaria TaxID=370345 RepID=A0ABD0LV05_9CAEN